MCLLQVAAEEAVSVANASAQNRDSGLGVRQPLAQLPTFYRRLEVRHSRLPACLPAEHHAGGAVRTVLYCTVLYA
jgi:hypothetical protein